MNRKMQKILSFLLTLCMLLTNAPFPALAAEAGDAGASTTNGYYDASGNWVAGGTGSATYNVDGTEVTLSKTATPVAGQDNVFDITLRVETSTTTTTNTYYNAGAVVLVIDVSGSMAYCADCGSHVLETKYHTADCKHSTETNSGWQFGYGSYEYGSRVQSGETRMNAAKIAAQNFLSNYAGDDPNANRMLAIVSFSTQASTKLNWVNVAGGAGKNSYDAANNAILGLSANGGTNLDQGLATARNLLGQDAVSEISSKNVIALTDGVPTYYGTRPSGDGSSGSEATNSATAASAKAVRDTGATLYTVCFGVANERTYSGGPTVGDFLRDSVASAGKAYNADNSSELYSAFAKITESITSGLTGSDWTATDPMADMISVTSAPANFTGSEGNYTWTLGDATEVIVNGNTTTYVYTVTYRVTLDVQGQNFEENKFFPTNDETYLNLTDGTKLAFPVPGVKGVLPRTDVTVTKVWDDNDNRDNKRIDAVTVVLKNAEGKQIGESVVLNAANNWTYTWDGETYDLIARQYNKDIVYTVQELDVPDGYAPVYSTGKNKFDLVVINTHEVETKNVTVTKIWEDNNNQDGIRPSAITVNLLADGKQVATAELTAANGWTHTFEGLEVNREGKVGEAIVYTVAEPVVAEGYTASVSGLVITNTHEVYKTQVSVTKVWDDADNQDGKRPQTAEFALYANGEDTGKKLTVMAPSWSGTFENLDLMKDGKEIKYTVQEVNVAAGYTAAVTGNAKDGFTVTNSHTPETTSVSGAKTWMDADNQDGKRPESITINLLADGKQVASKVVKPDANGNWTWTFDNLPVYKAGKMIKYTISEDPVPEYASEVNGFNVTNTHTPAQTSVQIQKIWEDDNNRDGIRPGSITVELLANGEKVDELTLTATSGWAGVFNNLPEYANGTKITYTIQEIEVEGYETEIENEGNGKFTVTNTHEISTVNIPVVKKWDDANNQDGMRPDSITVYLMNGDEIVDQAVLSAENEWKYAFTNLPEKAQGQIINYTVVEDAVEGYTTKIDGNNVLGYTITNTHIPGKTSVQVSKSWYDDDNRDGIRPKSVTIYLVINGVTSEQKITLSSQTNWMGYFEDLPEFQNGVKQEYAVEEAPVNGYVTQIAYNETTNTWEIRNSHEPKRIEISGSKKWEDANNQDGKRPESITVHLKADGEVIRTVEVKPDAAGSWTWSFTDLFEYAGGKKIVYTIAEGNLPEGYVATYDGYNIINSYTPEKTSVQVEKVWDDAKDQDGKRPNTITVNLLADGVVVQTQELTAANNWSYSFADLDKYADGVEIKYTVEEEVPEHYEAVIAKNETNTGFIITNVHTPELISIQGVKVWEDNEDQDGKRPEEITVYLMVKGEYIKSTTASAETEWKWSFNELPKYADGQIIDYVVVEGQIEDYTTKITGDIHSGIIITNKHEPAKVSIPVVKVWLDDNDRDGLRPENITLVLLADGEPVKELVLTDATEWQGVFEDLPKFAAGKEIVYTVEELAVAGYTTDIAEADAAGIIKITNTHEIETVNVEGTKIWEDNDNQDGKRPASITVKLMADGVEIDTAVVGETEEWKWSFTNLPMYKNHGQLIEYSIVEEKVDEYTTAYNDYDVINTHAPEKISITVTKAWDDNDNQDGIRANDVVVVLLANGEETATMTLNQGNKWTDSFTDLDKYRDGEEIDYTIEEKEVVGYTTTITGNLTEGFVITNSHTPETITVEGEKIWEDNDNQDGKRPESITVKLLANGKVINSVVVTEEDGWKWSFEGLDKFEQGVEIVYSLLEEAVEGYSAEYEGYDIVNTHTPEETSVSVVKAWMDNNDQDGLRPEKITVILLANGEATGETLDLDADCNWTGSFTELPKFEDGVEIEYTVEEIEVEGYQSLIIGDMISGYIITNSHTPETIEISGTKTWNDNNNQDGVRPESITVNLLANGQVIQTATVTEAEQWSYSFADLPKYENGGVEIIYSITETAVEGYTTTYDGYNIINSYTPAEIGITVTKAWADSDDKDGLRPGKITIVLYADGEKTDKTLVLTADDNWTGSFVGLPKFANGVEIVYTVGEVAVKGYNTVIRGDATKGFVVTNSHTVIPQTGDERTPIMWMLMMFASVAAVAYVGFDSKKKRNAK